MRAEGKADGLAGTLNLKFQRRGFRSYGLVPVRPGRMSLTAALCSQCPLERPPR